MAEYKKGSMNIESHREMWGHFQTITIWVGGLVVLTLIGLSFLI